MARKPIASIALIVLVVFFLFTTRRYTQHSDALSRYNPQSPESEMDGSGSEKSNMHEQIDHSQTDHSQMDHSGMDSTEMEKMHEEADMERMHEEMENSGDHKHENSDKTSEKMDKAHMEGDKDEKNVQNKASNSKSQSKTTSKVSDDIPDMEELSKGKPIMAKMPNQTIRAQVGNAGWKLLHTILAQYPEEPSEEDQQTLGTFLKFFSRVYPCRECAEHFQDMLAKFPPQLSSRNTAAMWGCDAHNKVNKRLGKPIFDCAYIFDEYDCGCGEEADPNSEETAAHNTNSDSDANANEKASNKNTDKSASKKDNKGKDKKAENAESESESTEEMMSTDK